METPPPPARTLRPPLTYRKLFHWGLVFWVLLWLASLGTLQSVKVWMKGVKDYGIGTLLVGEGTVSYRPHGDVGFPVRVMEYSHKEIWSEEKLKLIRNYPEILIADLGKFGVTKQGVDDQYSFPIAGFLWIWLSAGFYGETKLLRNPVAVPVGAINATVGSRKRVVLLGGALLALGVVIGLADHMSRRAAIAHSCAMRIRLAQSARLFTPADAPLTSQRGLSPGFSYGTCPCESPGAPFATGQLPQGAYAAQCPHEDHRRYLAGMAELK